MQIVSPSRTGVSHMFDKLAARYDLTNRVLSFGLDVGWRRRLARFAKGKGSIRVLDLASGTGDVAIAVARANPEAILTLADPSMNMLELARKKFPRGTFMIASAERLPFSDRTFDLVTMGFGIRNAVDVDRALCEMRRVLVPGGSAQILEFSTPIRPLRAIHRLYLHHLLPRIGGALTGNRAAYEYLNKTIETFPSGEAFCEKLRAAGFSNVRARPLTFGVVTIYSATSPNVHKSVPEVGTYVACGEPRG